MPTIIARGLPAVNRESKKRGAAQKKTFRTARRRNNFRFTISERAAANVDTIKRSSNNVIDFMESEGYFRFKADYSISSKDFYEIYKLWCEDNACHSVSAIRFSAELRQNDRRYNLEATNNIYLPGGRRVRGFVGIEPLVHPCP